MARSGAAARACAQAYLHVYAMQGGMSAWLWEKVSCVPVVVADLTYMGGTLSVELTWTEPVAYDIVRIRRDGVQVAEVAPGARRFSETFAAPGEHAYDVRGVAAGYESNSATCMAAAAERPFVRGDANNDVTLNIADAIFVLEYLFAKGTPPPCADAANANADRRIDVADAVRILDRLFGARTPLPQPFPGCGNAAEPGIGCDSSVCK
ncbi:MAG: hypothetical protein NTY65_08115 [Planctomycetota bacterium]|nr:hypothetical protein [Planctomycetota bacterium]